MSLLSTVSGIFIPNITCRRLLSSWRAMSSSAPSRDEILAMSRGQLLEFALRHASANSAANPSPLAALSSKPTPTPPSMSSPPTKKQKKGKPARVFTMSAHGQRLIALKFSYLGWHFHGLASQPQDTSLRAVEDFLFHALVRTKLISSRTTCDYSRAGRTDIGVSALGQVVGVRVRSNVVAPSRGGTELDYVRIINSALPKEIRVMCWAAVSDGTGGAVEAAGDEIVRRPGKAFSARFDAVHRSYKYFFSKGDLDIAAMREACVHFVGRHDFRNFCKMDVETVSNFERVMYDVEVRRLEDDDATSNAASDGGEFARYYFYVRGQAFLWHQIRCMVGVLFQVGRGNEEPGLVRRMLEDAEKGTGHFSQGKPLYEMAPAMPLLFYDCAYPRSVVQFAVGEDQKAKGIEKTAFGNADAELARLYGEATAQAAVVSTMLDSNDRVVCNWPVEGGGKTFGEMRRARGLVPASKSGFVKTGPQHIPFESRRQESTAAEKMRILGEKRARVVLEKAVNAPELATVNL